MWRKQAKIEAMLGEHWQWPKGMRHHTHERLLEAVMDCEDRRNRAFYDLAARLFGGIDKTEDIVVGRA